jgi:hypothetical protein
MLPLINHRFTSHLFDSRQYARVKERPRPFFSAPPLFFPSAAALLGKAASAMDQMPHTDMDQNQMPHNFNLSTAYGKPGVAACAIPSSYVN